MAISAPHVILGSLDPQESGPKQFLYSSHVPNTQTDKQTHTQTTLCVTSEHDVTSICTACRQYGPKTKV